MELNDFPTELIKHIISFSEPKTKLVARVINKKWFNIIDERDFVTDMVSKDQIAQVVETFSRCAKPIYLSFMRNKFRSLKDLSSHITKMTNLTGLEIEIIRQPSSTADWMALTVLTDLQYLKVLQNSETIPNQIYGYIYGLTSLKDLRTKAAADLSCLENLSHLQSLEINCKKEYNPFKLISNPRILTELIAIGKRFRFEPADVDSYVGLKDLIYDEMESNQLFPVGKLTNLESLGITAYDIDEYPSTLTSLSVQDVPPRHMTNLTNLGFLRVTCNEDWPENERKDLFSYIKSSGLLELSLKSVHPDNASKYFQELAKFTNIEYLTLDFKEGNIDGAVLSKAINSLTNLVDLDLLFFLARRTPDVSIEISTALTRLTELTVYRGKVAFEDVSKITSLKAISSAKIVKFEDLLRLTRLEEINDVPRIQNFVRSLTNFQSLKSLSTTHDSTALHEEIGKLTSLTNLNVSVHESLNMEIWTNLGKLTWLDLEVMDSKPLDNLTLLTSLQLITMSLDSLKQFRLDEQALFEKLPDLYDVDVMYY